MLGPVPVAWILSLKKAYPCNMCQRRCETKEITVRPLTLAYRSYQGQNFILDQQGATRIQRLDTVGLVTKFRLRKSAVCAHIPLQKKKKQEDISIAATFRKHEVFTPQELWLGIPVMDSILLLPPFFCHQYWWHASLKGTISRSHVIQRTLPFDQYLQNDDRIHTYGFDQIS